jgi:hypothetical protein
MKKFIEQMQYVAYRTVIITAFVVSPIVATIALVWIAVVVSR